MGELEVRINNIYASICIPAYNGEDYIESLLDMALKQVLPYEFEVIVIDSGSTDRTLEIIKKFKNVKLHEIPNSEFGHGKTRNLAASMAKGEYVVFLSQDAVPAHNRWLEFMLEPFMIKDVACVFGKQIPRPFCDATTKREVSSVFNSLGPDHSISINRKDSLLTKKVGENYLTFFSDVNSAVRKDFLLNIIPYRDVRYSEDQLFGRDVLDAGYLKAYAPQGSVFHSNEYSVKDSFYRKYDEFLGMHEVLNVLPPHGHLIHVKRWVGDVLRDYLFILRDPDYPKKQKLRNLVGSPMRNYYREKAAFYVSKPDHREKNKLKLSLESRKKK